MSRKSAPIRIDLAGLLCSGVTNTVLRKRAGAGRRAMRRMAADEKTGLMDFTRLPHDADLLKASLRLAEERRDSITDLIVCGIGGSALGFLALADALLHPRHNELPFKTRKAPRYYVLDNADAEALSACLDVVRLDRALIVVISKSGGGGETIANFLALLGKLLEKRGRNLKKALGQVVIITDPKTGPLRRVADDYDVAHLPIPPNVGGRFSVLSPVGVFPAAVLRIPVKELLTGAGAMLARCQNPDPLENPAMRLALLLDAHDRLGRSITVMMPYGGALWRTADWFRQLWAESLGKALDRGGRVVHRGMTPMAALGATDQHSQVQLYAEGPDDKTYLFLRTRSRAHIVIPKPPFEADAYGFLGGKSMDALLRVEGDATEAALAHFRRPTARISLPATTPHALGQLLIFLEMTTACVGALWNINTFNQPGVELGKVLTRYRMGLKSAGDKIIDEKTGLRARDIVGRQEAKRKS